VRPDVSPKMDLPIGPAGNWRKVWVSVKTACKRIWQRAELKASPTGALHDERRILISSARRPTSLAFISIHRSTQPSFCVDEKTALQALDRLDPVLPMSPGRAERHGFEYYRHGTLSLYAALDVQTGKVLGKTAARHTSMSFVLFLEQVMLSCKPRQEIHIILDNLSAHKTKKVAAFLEQHPRVQLHFTPTYSLGLTRSRYGSLRIERDVISAASSSPCPICLAS